MSNSLILYVGTPEAGRAFAAAAEAENNYAYLPENLMQTLGMYITYFPHMTVIDMALDYAQEAFEHLRSVDASPLILLADDPQPIRSTVIYTLPRDLAPAALVSALERLHPSDPPARQQRSNGVLHFA